MMDREVLGYIVHQIGDTTFGKIKVSTEKARWAGIKMSKNANRATK